MSALAAWLAFGLAALFVLAPVLGLFAYGAG